MSMACVRAAFSASLAVMLWGCGGPSVLSVAGDCSTDTATIGFPPTAGFTASAQIHGQDCLDGSKFSVRSGTTVIAGPAFNGHPGFGNGLPDSFVTVWLYMSYQFEKDEYTAGAPSVTVTVPPTLLIPGRVFHLADDDNSTGLFLWDTSTYELPTVNGATLYFAGDMSTPNIRAGSLYQLALYSTGA
jgi:hypothetical protein